ncbi:MAG TPA: hypothetical protein VFL59_01330, partial [Candidatus Nanopelagicales bacterium]|nr:hypothetical protein [Candidatus Nanopelagicales bacterium]
MSDVVVRAASAEDLSAVALVRALTWQAAYAGQVADEELRGLADPDVVATWAAEAARRTTTTYLVAEADGAVIGFAALGVERSERLSPFRGEL